MIKIRLFFLSLIFFILFIPSMLLAEDLNEIAYQNRFLLKAGTILNSEGIGDCLILPYYDVRKVNGKKQITEINIENFGAYGVVAKLRFREWSRGTEVFSKDIWIPSSSIWNGQIEINEDGTNAKITSSSNLIWYNDSNSFYLSTSLTNGTLFSTRTIRKGLGESTLSGYVEVIGAEKTSPDNFNGKVGRLAKSEQDCPNTLRGNVLINRVDDGVSMTYHAIAIGNFSRGQGSLFRSVGSPYPRLDTCEDTLDQLEFQLSKWEVFGPFSVSSFNQGKTSLIMTFPTKPFHYSNGKRISQINNPFEALKETTGETLDTRLSQEGNPSVESFITLPFSVNVIGLYKDYYGGPLGIDNISLPTHSYDFGEITITSDGIAQRVLIQDYEYLQERFSMYRGLPSLGLLLQEFKDQGQLYVSITPAEYSAVWEKSNLESVFIPTILSGPSFGTAGGSYTYTTGGSRSSLGHPIQYLIDWGDGTNSDWLASGITSASKTWTIGGVYTIRSRARCAFHTDVMSAWSSEFTVTIESVSTPTVLSGPVTGLPNTTYTYTTGGSFSSAGHPVQYFFDWGDTTDSGWLPVGTTTATKFWMTGGEYTVKVMARCASDTSVVSDWTSGLIVKIEFITTPNAPVGPDKGLPGVSYTYMTGGASSNIDDPIQYFFDWGDGTNSGWLASGTSASKSWATGGTYSVKARARCVTHPDLLSGWSPGLTVNIELISVSTPAGPTTGSPNTLYTYTANGNSNIGDPVQIRFIFSDGGDSGWLSAGTTSFSKMWPSAGSFTVTAKARCAIHTNNESAWSAVLAVTINNPAPTLASILPTSGNRGQTLDVRFNGTNFFMGITSVSFGSDITVNSISVDSVNQITVNITITIPAATGARNVSVTNPGPGGGTATLTNGFTVNNPAPTTTSISPTSMPINDPSFTLTVNGTNFVSNSVVQFNGSDRTATFVSSTQLTAIILDSDLTVAGPFPITVFNPAPVGGTSNAQTFTVNP